MMSRYSDDFDASGDSASPAPLHTSTGQQLDGLTIIPTSPKQRRRIWTICLFSITTLLLFADQNLMAPNLTAIADEFGFDDQERDRKLGGDISLAFFLLGAPASIVIGFLADSSDRSVVFAWTVFIGEGACLATYWVQTYSQLYVCRAVTGFSVGGAIPLIYSVLGDLFAAEDRHVVSALVSFGTGSGIAVGQAIAGFLGPTHGWRLPFLVVALPALITAALVLFTVPDPERGAMEPTSETVALNRPSSQSSMARSPSSASRGPTQGGVALVPLAHTSQGYNDEPSNHTAAVLEDPLTMPSIKAANDYQSHTEDDYLNNVYNQNADDVLERFYCCGIEMQQHMNTMMQLMKTPTAMLAILQGAPGCIPWGIINVFLNDYLSENRGFSIQMATATLMFFSLGHACGLMIGGGLGKQLYRANKKYPSILAGTTAIGGCFPLWVLINWVDVNTPYWRVVFIAGLAGVGSGPTGPIIKATLTNATLPRSRGQAFAFCNLFDDFGKGLGPFFVSVLIARMGGRTPAFNVGVLGWVACGLANLAIFFFVEQDEALVQTRLARMNHRSPRDLSM